MKKNILFVVILVLMCVIASAVTYVVMDKKIRKTNETNNITNKEENKEQDKATSSEEELQKYLDKGYNVLNLNNIDLSEDLESITTEQYFDKNNYSVISRWDYTTNFSYKLNNGKAFFEYNGEIYNIPINDVKKIFWVPNGCGKGPTERYYLIDNNGNIYESLSELDSFEQLKNLSQNFKKINNNIKYEDAFAAWGFPGTCTYELTLVGVTSEDKKYDILTEQLYEKSRQSYPLIFESWTLNVDRTIAYLEDKDIIKDKKIKVFIGSSNSSKNYVITEDDKIYELKQSSELINNKVKNILYKNTENSEYDKDITIMFDNGEKIEITGTRLIYDFNNNDFKYVER